MALVPVLGAGAHPNGGSPVSPGAVLGAGASAAPAEIHVALFFDPTYVDTATDGGGEAYNLQQTLLDAGFTVTTFTGVTTADWTTALATAQVAVPELEVSNSLGANLEAGALAALQAFVNAGGQLLNFDAANWPFMDVVLGLAPGTVDGNESCPCTKTAAAAGTAFAGGPDTLAENNATDTVDVTTLPVGTTVIYADDDDRDEAGLALIPLGSGRLVYFGWDWFFDDEETEQFPPWFEVLSLAIAGQPQPPPPPGDIIDVTPRFPG